MNLSNINKTHIILLSILVPLIAALAFYTLYKPPIKIGVMHSLTGHMAESETPIVEAVLFSIEEINKAGGLNGRKIIPIVKDGESDPAVFMRVAEELIVDEQVEVVFGCWTSSCRKSVLPIFEIYDHLLYYPLQYEGMERSENIIYLGAVPNQQLVPALEWSLSELGKSIYLVGSDYVFPRAANEVIRDKSQQWRGEIVGEQYVRLGSESSEAFKRIAEDIKQKQPDVIFNTVNGTSNLVFFKALRNAGIYPKDIPTISFSISEDELRYYDGVELAGDILVWNYLQGLDNALNQNFVKAFKHKYGKDRSIGNPMITAYTGVKLWAKAVELAGSSDVRKVRAHASDLSINGPSGMMYVEPVTQHTWKSVHIAKISKDKRLESIWYSKVPIAPEPYPSTRSTSEWDTFLVELRNSWDGQWQAI